MPSNSASIVLFSHVRNKWTSSSSSSASSPSPSSPSSSSSSLFFTKDEHDLRRVGPCWTENRTAKTTWCGINNNNNNNNDNNDECPKILACSSSSLRGIVGVKRNLLSDKKTPLEHLRPKSLALSSMRLVILQSGQMLSSYLEDQIEHEMANEELVVQGDLTSDEADQKNDQWAKQQWSTRLRSLPRRVVSAMIKVQSATLIMRGYEHLADRWLRVSTQTLDRLTKDSFGSAQRKQERGRPDIGRAMFRTCLWSSAVGFLSDWTVQQTIFTWGWGWCYYRHLINRRNNKQQQQQQHNNQDQQQQDIQTSGIWFHFLYKSSSLATSRIASWIFSSVTGACGSYLYPGWGTLFGTQLGDGLVGALMDD